MLQVLTVLVVLVVLGGPALGAAPAGFRNIPWGANPDQVVRAFPRAHCERTSSGTAGDWSCHIADETFGKGAAQVTIWGYTAGRARGMAAYALTFDGPRLQEIREAFEADYGAPAAVEDTAVLTKGGRQIATRIWWWRVGDTQISLAQHAPDEETATATIALQSGVEESQAREAERVRQPRKEMHGNAHEDGGTNAAREHRKGS